MKLNKLGICGLISLLSYTAMVLLSPLKYPGYNWLTMAVSDLSADVAPSQAFTEAHIRNWISRNKDRYETFEFGLWAVCLKDSGEMIGDCGLTMQKIGDVIRPEIGYHIRRDLHRQGYAKEAAIAVRDWTFQNTPFRAIYSYMKYDNVASCECAKAWGCKQIVEYEDPVNEITKVYRITKDEWKFIIRVESDNLVI